MYVRVCVCVCERERERERGLNRVLYYLQTHTRPFGSFIITKLSSKSDVFAFYSERERERERERQTDRQTDRQREMGWCL